MKNWRGLAFGLFMLLVLNIGTTMILIKISEERNSYKSDIEDLKSEISDLKDDLRDLQYKVEYLE